MSWPDSLIFFEALLALIKNKQNRQEKNANSVNEKSMGIKRNQKGIVYNISSKDHSILFLIHE